MILIVEAYEKKTGAVYAGTGDFYIFGKIRQIYSLKGKLLYDLRHSYKV